MVLSNSKSMHTRIQNSEISIQGLQVQYSTFHPNRIKIQIILLILQLEQIISPAIYFRNDPCKAVALQSTQRLPVASFHSFYTKKSMRFFQY